MKRSTIIAIGVVATLATIVVATAKDHNPQASPTSGMRIKLTNLLSASEKQSKGNIFLTQMSDAEIADVYTYWFTYNHNFNTTPTALKQRVQAISTKYNIFN